MDVTKQYLVKYFFSFLKWIWKSKKKYQILSILGYNGTIGIQRGCAQIPEDSIEGECNFEDILNGTTKAEVCYCRGNSCNSGDIFTTTKIPTKDPSTFPPSLWNS